MATYDTVIVKCPDCGAELEFQTKARYGWGGDFETFTADNAPSWARFDLDGEELTCSPCGRRVQLDSSLSPHRMLHRGRKDP